MSYIKTKEGIWEVVLIKPTCIKVKKNNIFKWFAPDEILKKAETKDELINRYIIRTEGRNFSYKILSKLRFGKLNSKELLNRIKQGNTSVYGAIWTDKGLVYIAKMNDKLEMELL